MATENNPGADRVPGASRWGAVWSEDATSFAIWAPSAAAVELVRVHSHPTPLAKAGDGWHRATVPGLRPGDRYRFRIDGSLVPDPASRRQPDGVDGASALVDPRAFAWTDAAWHGRPWTETVLYELHVGTFTPEGTFLGAIARLDHLANLGVTMIELMPVESFPGSRNWGYDGVLPFAPSETYGTPDDLRRLVDQAHRRGISVVVDVVYNHFGPTSNYLETYAPEFFTDRHETPWGGSIDFDGPQSNAVRAYFVENALEWLTDFHCDGLRLDAVQAIFDAGATHILEEIARKARAAAPDRPIHLMLENDKNEARWLERQGDTAPYDGQWNDDFHHVMRVLLAGQTDGYYEDYAEEPLRRLGRTLAEGFSYQGEESRNRPGLKRGTPSGHLPPSAFVAFLQNHDQVGNSAYGRRLTALAPEEAVRLGTAILLLAPSIPMLFMGQEWGSSRPFDFFCDYPPPLCDRVREGRREEFRKFREFADEAALDTLADPNAASTRDGSVNDWREIEMPAHAAWLAFHEKLIAVRKASIVPLLPAIDGHAGSFEVLPGHTDAQGIERGVVVARWRLSDGRTLVLAANVSDRPADWTAGPSQPIFRMVEGDAGLAPWDVAVALAAADANWANA